MDWLALVVAISGILIPIISYLWLNAYYIRHDNFAWAYGANLCFLAGFQVLSLKWEQVALRLAQNASSTLVALLAVTVAEVWLGLMLLLLPLTLITIILWRFAK